MTDNYKYMVSARCFTYNQAPYIRETLDGFTMQQTNFPYVCLIVDDASTDGQQEVIREYIDSNFKINDDSSIVDKDTANFVLTSVQHNSNSNCQFVVLFLKENHYSIKKTKIPYLAEWNDNAKYHAMCEGDDCWIHPQKLQMQVDFMEDHPDYGMIHTDFDLTKGRRRHIKEDSNDDGTWFPRILIEGMSVGTCTVMLRKSVFDKTPKVNLGKGWPMGDFPMWIEMAHEAKVKYLPVVTAKYRVLESSASHSKDIKKMIAFCDALREIKMFYASYYGVKILNDGYTPSYYEGIVRSACRLDDLETAEHYYKEAKRRKMCSFKCYLFYIVQKHKCLKSLIELYIKI